MTTIREYLEDKAAQPEREWVRRKPATTHPEILALVREFVAGGGTYNDDAERFVEARAGDLPPHQYHGHPARHRLTDQLGSEVYLARSIIRDEAEAATNAALEREGFAPLDPAALIDGARYVVRFARQYVGHSVPQYGRAVEVRAHAKTDGGFMFLPKGARTRGYAATTFQPTLIKAVT